MLGGKLYAAAMMAPKLLVLDTGVAPSAPGVVRRGRDASWLVGCGLLGTYFNPPLTLLF